MKKFTSFMLTILMIFAMASPAFAADYSPSNKSGYVYATVEINTLGDGFLYEPIKVPFTAGESYEDILLRLIGIDNMELVSDPDWGSYISDLVLPRDIFVDVPQIILDKTGAIQGGKRAKGSLLGQIDYYSESGWMFTTNNEMAPVGITYWYAEDGDVLRFQFSVCGYGADLGFEMSWSEDPPMYIRADKDALIKAVAEINSSADKAKILDNADVLADYKHYFSQYHRTKHNNRAE